MSPAGESAPELSVVIPCLNEAATVGGCVREALAALASAGIVGEVVVADNGSSDDSRRLAEEAGARVVPVARRGYGAALMAGIEASKGRYLVMGDADGSYDFGEIPRLLIALRAGHDLAQGCRLPKGGGRIEPGAMPPLHRWLGNPGLSRLARWMFRTPVNDVYCGLRGFSRELYERLNLRCTGMEFATEMIIKSALHRAPTTEVPITLRRDGRGGRPSHLRTFHDGWRTLRLFLLLSPRWAHLIPGLALAGAGLVAALLGLCETRFGHVRLGPHTLLVGATSIIVGQQALWVGVFSRAFAALEGITPPKPELSRLLRDLTLERMLTLGALLVLAGAALIGCLALRWRASGFADLDYASSLRLAVPGGLLVALGAQTITGGLVLGLLGLERK